MKQWNNNQKIRKHRRNFLPTFTVNIILWGLFIFIILKSSPEYIAPLTIYDLRFTIHVNIILFFISLSLALSLTMALLCGNTRRGLFLSLFVNSLLIFQLAKQASWINLVLLLAIYLTAEFYFSSRKNKQKSPNN